MIPRRFEFPTYKLCSMGWWSRRLDEYNEARYYYDLGCEVLGPPSTKVGIKGSIENADRMRAGRVEAARRESIEEAKRRSAAVYGAPSRDDGYFSQDRGFGAADYFLDKNGVITSERPHLHVVHNPREGAIIFTVTLRDGSHPITKKLPIDASGNEVNAMQSQLLRFLD